jgi:hypothetical protein
MGNKGAFLDVPLFSDDAGNVFMVLPDRRSIQYRYNKEIDATECH